MGLRRASKVLVWGTGILLALAPIAAQAQPAGEVEGKAAAAQAVRDAQAGRYAVAVEGFRKAYELNPNPSYLFNLASICIDGLKDPARAHPWAVRYLDVARDAKERGEAEALLRQIDDALSRTHVKVEILVNPADADLYLDRKAPENGLAHTAWVPPGAHTILAEAPDHDPAQAQVTARRGVRLDVALILEPQQPLVRIDSRTKDVVLFLDGMRLGAPPIEVRMKPGAHVVRAEAQGYRAHEQKLDLKPGQVLVVRADLAAVATTQVPKAEPVLAAPARKPAMSPRRIGAWTAIGAGAALVVAGAATYGAGYQVYNDMADNYRVLDPRKPTYGTDWKRIQSQWDSAMTKRNAAIACWALGGAALATGLVLYFLPEKTGAAVAPIGPGGPGVSALVRF